MSFHYLTCASLTGSNFLAGLEEKNKNSLCIKISRLMFFFQASLDISNHIWCACVREKESGVGRYFVSLFSFY